MQLTQQSLKHQLYLKYPVEPETPVEPEKPAVSKTPVNLGSDFLATITGVDSGMYIGITSNNAVLKTVTKVPSS